MVKNTIGKKPLHGTPEMREFMARVADLKRRKPRQSGIFSVSEREVETPEKVTKTRKSRRPKKRRAGDGFDQSPEDTDSAKTRRRLRVNNRNFDRVSSEEERMIAQALKNSLIDTKKIDFVPPEAPVYHPSIDEFRDPLEYISRYRLAISISRHYWNLLVSGRRLRDMGYAKLYPLRSGNQPAL